MAKAAIGQICSSASMARNLEVCVDLVARAAAAGAKVLFLPEASDYISFSTQESLRLARPAAQSPFVTGLQSAAKQHGLAVHVGIHEPVPAETATESPAPDAGTATGKVSEAQRGAAREGVDGATTPTKLYNRTIWINADGTLNPAGTYDKLHLFDYATAGLRESANTRAGASLTAPFNTPVGRVGPLICFDMRFPEPSLALARPGPASPWAAAPAHILTYSSAFTVPTGRAHWEALLRARAIESAAWVVAAAQVGRHDTDPDGGRGKRVSYGHSMVVDPWGKVVLELGGVEAKGEGAVDGPDTWEAEDGAVGQLGVVDIDLGLWESVRERLPLTRRTDVYPEL